MSCGIDQDLLVKAGCFAILLSPRVSMGRLQRRLIRFSAAYRGTDFPMAWDVDSVELVHMYLQDGAHYDLDTPIGIAEWRSLIPRDSGVVRLGPRDRMFGLSMFHQLGCLDEVRAALVSTEDLRAWPYLQHCMDYLRQAVFCRGDLTLQNYRNIDKFQLDWEKTMTCRDWDAVYRAVEVNQASSSR